MYILNEVLLLNAIIKPCCFIWKSLEQVVLDLVGIQLLPKGILQWQRAVHTGRLLLTFLRDSMFALVYWSPYNLAFEAGYFTAMIMQKTHNTKKTFNKQFLIF